MADFSKENFGIEVFSKGWLDVNVMGKIATTAVFETEMVVGLSVEGALAKKKEYNRPFYKKKGEEPQQNSKNITKGEFSADVIFGIKRGEHIKEIQEETQLKNEYIEAIEEQIEIIKQRNVVVDSQDELYEQLLVMVDEKIDSLIEEYTQIIDERFDNIINSEEFFNQYKEAIENYLENIKTKLETINRSSEICFSLYEVIKSRVSAIENKVTSINGALRQIGENSNEIAKNIMDVSHVATKILSGVTIISSSNIKIDK
ncbi:hypothetical protein [Nautilia lithotrophica]